MTERGVQYALREIKKHFDEKYPDLLDDQTESMAREVIDAVDWENSALMHKGLRWIAEEVYKEKINKRFAEINSRPAEELSEEEAASLAEAEAINDETTVELHEFVKRLEKEISDDRMIGIGDIDFIEGYAEGFIVSIITFYLERGRLPHVELIRRFEMLGLDDVVASIINGSNVSFLLGWDRPKEKKLPGKRKRQSSAFQKIRRGLCEAIAHERKKSVVKCELNAAAEDDAFCQKLYEEYLADSEREEFVALEIAAEQLGVNLEGKEGL